MYNGKYIVTGIVLFAVLMLAPFLYNIFTGTSYAEPELALPKDVKECIEATEFMRSEHMDLLDVWRDEVVREGKREYIATNGKKWEISLQNTCMNCHTNKQDFCDKCHDAASVDPYCWTCHLEPEGNNQ